MIIIDNQYIANITYYKKIVNDTHVIFDQYEDHRKRSFANRSAIAGANGKINLSIPLEKGRSQKSLAKDVKISNAENWQLRHWRSILSSYNNSPWFKFYSDSLAVVFSTRFEFLFDWNLVCFDWIVKQLKLDMTYELTNAKLIVVMEGMADFRYAVTPGGPVTHSVKYQQVYENKTGFIEDLSILDVLFCEGPKRSLALLKGEI